MTSDNLSALIARLEAATGPSRVLDADIWLYVYGWTMHEESDPTKGIFAFWEGEPWKSICHNCSSWSSPTSSYEEALSLVPSICTWAAGDLNEDDLPWACVTDDVGNDFSATGATPVLALCIAALKARQTAPTGEHTTT